MTDCSVAVRATRVRLHHETRGTRGELRASVHLGRVEVVLRLGPARHSAALGDRINVAAEVGMAVALADLLPLSISSPIPPEQAIQPHA